MTSLLDLPGWVAALRGEGLSDIPLRWLEQDEAQARRDALLEAWGHVPFDDEFKARCADRVARCAPVAAGPTRRARVGDRAEELTLLFDPEHPEDLVAALGERIPSALWVPLGRTAASLRDGLAPYLTGELRSAHRFTRVQRVFKGTAEQLGLTGLDQLAQAIAGFETWIDPASWGSAQDDDPWPADTSSLSMIEFRILLDDCRKQDPGRFASYSFRTLWSRSVLRIEQQAFDSFVFELRYEPSLHPEVIRGLEEIFPFQLAEDVPVDLAASLLRGPTVTPAFLEAALAREGRVPFLALAKCALEPGEPAAMELLRAMLPDPETRGAAIELAGAYAYRGLLYEALATTEDDELRGDLERYLAPHAERDEDESGEGDEDDDDLDDDDLDDDDDFDDDDDLDDDEGVEP